MKKYLMAMIVVGFVVGTVSYGYASSQQVIKVGSLWPMTGPGALWGLPFHNVIQFQADAINAEGGITVGGEKYLLEIIKEDSKYIPAEARKAAEKLIYQDRVKFILGPLGGGSLNAIKPLLNQNKVINIVVVNALDAIGPDKPYCFRAFMGVGEIYTALLEYFLDNHGVKNIQALDWDVESARSAAEDFKIACKMLGIKPPKQMFYPRDTKDFYPAMTKLVAEKSDIIITGGPPAHQALQAKAARELGYKGILFNSTPTPVDKFLQVVDKKVMEGYFNTASIDEGPLAPIGVIKWKEQWIAAGKKWEDSGGPVTTNFLPLLVQGIEAAGSVDNTDKIKNALENIEYNSPVFGPCKWGGKERYGINHNILYPVDITQIRDGKAVGIYVIPPEKLKPIMRPK